MNNSKLRMENLPKVDEVSGIYFNPTTEMAEVQFKSKDIIYVLEVPLNEILKSEEWFIKLRQSLAPVFGKVMQEKFKR